MRRVITLVPIVVLIFLGVLTGCANTTAGRASDKATALSPSSMPRLGSIDERYQSYNIEMLELTGGKFWKPYGDRNQSSAGAYTEKTSAPGDTPAGMDPSAYAYRPPIDLTNARRRKLAAA